ncbi:hypothetical protein [Cellulomonas sp. Y8]|uniref:hypothetical protein n=1 Tax=Cellulomonas sp. Y8 TaxID=2591145 RepID=UPI0011C742D9|nr:hypothetical protein [Cellulomonas sp. Y8]
MTASGSVVVDPAELDVTGLAPGEAVVREVTVRNDSGVPVLLAWTRREEGALFAGGTPLGVGYAWDPGGGAACDGRPVVGAGSTLDLRVEVVLPAGAGDELQGATGTSTLDWVATALPGGVCPPGGGPGAPGGGDGGSGGGSTTAGDAWTGGLGATGAEVGVLALAAAVLLAAGAALVRGALRGRSRCPAG